MEGNIKIGHNNMFIPDTPISSDKEDILGRSKFSRALGETILSFKDTKSIVIGLYGAWGSGKSSVVNLLTERIYDIKAPSKEDILCLHFNPWNFSEQNQLITSFFNELANKLQYADKSSQAKAIAKKLKLYASFLNATETVSDILRYAFPVFFTFVSVLMFTSAYSAKINTIATLSSLIFAIIAILSFASKKILFSISDFFLEKSSFSKKTLEELKGELNSAILERGKKILIVIDDIDRLNPKEIKQIFQLVKINADFPNTIYLLPFERKIIEENLAEQKGISGKDYLKKIVQVDFDIPDVQKTKIYKFLFTQLDVIIKPIPEGKWDETHWGNLFHSGLKYFFQSLRDVKRFINSLNFNFLLVQKEGIPDLNPVDFIGIEAIRVFTPDFYYALRSKNSLFTSTESSSHSPLEKANARKEEIDALLSSSPTYLRSLICELFPQIRGLYEGTSYGAEFQATWKRERRVCATELFDRYFILDVPEGEIAQFEAEAVLNATSDRTRLTHELSKYISDGRIGKLLDLLETHTEKFNLEDAEAITTSLLDISDDLPEDKIAFSYIDSDMRLMRVIYHYLKRFKDSQITGKLLKSSIDNSKGLYGCVHKIGIELQGIEKESSNARLIPIESIQEFKELCAKKIASFADHPKLKRSKNLAYLLYAWNEWGQKDDASKFVQSLLENEGDIVFLIKSFISQSYSQSMGDYVGKVKKQVNYKGLAKFIELEKIKVRLGELDVSKLDSTDKENINLFLNNFDKRDKPYSHFDDDDEDE